MGIRKSPHKSINKRKWIVITAISIVHLVSSVVLVLMSFGVSMTRFETGIPATQGDRLIELGANILNFPLVSLVLLPNFPLRFINGVLGWLIYIANSLLWGIGIYTLVKLLIKLFAKNSAKKDRDRQ
jgi:hypothetical protein